MEMEIKVYIDLELFQQWKDQNIPRQELTRSIDALINAIGSRANNYRFGMDFWARIIGKLYVGDFYRNRRLNYIVVRL